MAVIAAVADRGKLKKPVVDGGRAQAQKHPHAGQWLAEHYRHWDGDHGQDDARRDGAPHYQVDVKDGEICEH